MRVIKGYHAEDREARVFADGVQRLLANVMRSLTAMSLMSLSATVLMGIVGALVMYLGTQQIYAGKMTMGQLIMFNAFLIFLVAPIVGVVNIGTQMSEALAGLERTREVLRERPEDDDPERTREIGPIVGEVLFENVEFAYETGKTVLHGISFEAKPGTVTAFVGPSGSGKSTTIGLISAFHKPVAGRILVDGVDLNRVKLPSYRTQLGVVLQETFLFDGSIRENVLFSRPDATEAELLEACRIARVDEFAEALEEGYDTIVGERGVKLSGGQRQRLSIARAILADPRILILDEATSSLDSESEVDDPAGSRAPDAGPHDFRHRAPAVDDSPRRPDPGDRSRKYRRARHASRVVCPARPLLGYVYAPARAGRKSVPRARRRRRGAGNGGDFGAFPRRAAGTARPLRDARDPAYLVS